MNLLPIALFFYTPGPISLWMILIVLLVMFPALRKWVLLLLGILLAVVLYTVSIWAFCGILAVLLGAAFCGIYRAHKEQQDWEAKQPPRATGYNPNNGWEYIEDDENQ